MDKGEFGGRVLDGLVRNACSLTSRVAAEDRCALEYSEDRQEGALRAALRLGGRLLLGLDLVHAWRNRRGIYSAEIVWTGTESQHLSWMIREGAQDFGLGRRHGAFFRCVGDAVRHLAARKHTRKKRFASRVAFSRRRRQLAHATGFDVDSDTGEILATYPAKPPIWRGASRGPSTMYQWPTFTPPTGRLASAVDKAPLTRVRVLFPPDFCTP